MPSTPRTGIPYPAAGDSPNMPSAMQAIASSLENQAKDDQGPIASRPVSTPGSPGKAGRYWFATDQNVLYRDHGTGWLPVHGIERGATLPSAATDTTMFDLLVDSTAGIVWTFRYVSAEPTYKWVYVGGTPRGFSEANSVNHTVNSTSYVNLSAAATVAVPNPGKYEVEFGCNMLQQNPNVGVALSFTFPIIGTDDPATDNNGIQSYALGTAPDTRVQIAEHHCRRVVQVTCTEAGNINIQGKVLAGAASTVNFKGLFMYIRPLQVSP